MSDYDPLMQELELEFQRRHENVRQMLYEAGRPDLVAELDRKTRENELGITGARATWHSISQAQRYTLALAWRHDGHLYLSGKEYRPRELRGEYHPIRVTTIRNLCARELMAWEGGIFAPEQAAMVTEHGQFVLRHGPLPNGERFKG